jgi:hypothetical protein
VKWYCAVTAGGKIQVSANLAEIGDGPLAVDLMLGEAAEQLECEVLVEVITQRQRRNDLGADIGIGAGDREAARGDRRIGVGIDHGGQHPHLDIAVVASGRGGERPANHAKSQRLKRSVPILSSQVPMSHSAFRARNRFSTYSWNSPPLAQSARPAASADRRQTCTHLAAGVAATTRIFLIQVSTLRPGVASKSLRPPPRHVDRDQGEDLAPARQLCGLHSVEGGKDLGHGIQHEDT